MSVREWRRAFRGAVSEGRARGRTSKAIAAEYGIPVETVAFWRKKKSYVNYDDPLHKACRSARTRMLAALQGTPEAGDIPSVAKMRKVFDGYRVCQICYEPLGDDVSVDHATPIARGGGHSWGNLLLTHRRCNSLKGQLTADEYGKLARFLRSLSEEAQEDINARLVAGGKGRYGR